jgi:hypothetical protein
VFIKGAIRNAIMYKTYVHLKLLDQQEFCLNSNAVINPLNAELNPIHHLLALVGARHIVHVSRVRVKKKLQCYV